MGWLKRRIARWALNDYVVENASDDKLLKFSEEYLKRTQKEHADNLRIAQRLNSAQLMNAQTRQLKEELKRGLDEDKDDKEDEDDDDEEEDFTNKMLSDVIKKVTNQIVNKSANPPVSYGMGQGSSIDLTAPVNPAAFTDERLQKLAKAWNGFNEDEKEVYYNYFKKNGIVQ